MGSAVGVGLTEEHAYPRALPGRVLECAQVSRAIKLAKDGACQRLWIQGAPGTGKTAFCEWARQQAESFQTVVSSGVEGEADLALGVLLSVVRGLRGHVERVSGPHRRLLRGLIDDGTGGSDVFSLGAATLSLLAEAAERQPVVVVLDDVQWIDQASTTVLGFALRRLDADAVVALLASRSSPVDAGLDRSVEIVEIGGLPDDAAAAVLARSGPIDSQVAASVIAATGGIPLALQEVAAQLSPAQRMGFEPLPEPLPVGDRLLSFYRTRMAPLDDDARLALAVAAAAGSAMHTTSRALAALHLPGDALRAAELVQVVHLTPVGPVFPHPLLRTASLAAVTASQRRRVHQALADVSLGLEEQALHLVRSCSGPSEEVADRLEAIASSLSDRHGAVTSAGAWFDAGRLSPPGPTRIARLLRASFELAGVGRVGEAKQCLDEIIATGEDPIIRADAVTISTWMRVLSPDAAGVGHEAAAEADRIDTISPVHAQRLRATAATSAIASGLVATAIHILPPALAGPGVDQLPPTLETTSPAQLLCLDGRLEEANAWLPPARVQLFARLAADGLDDPVSSGAFQMAVAALIWSERLDEALVLATTLISHRRQSKRPQDLPLLLISQAETLAHAGRWPQAEAALGEAITLAEDTRQPRMGDLAIAFTARLAAGRGQAHYQPMAEDALSRARYTQNKSLEVYALHALGLGHLTTGRLQESVGAFDRLSKITSEVGLRNPAVVRYQADQIEALIRHGSIGKAVDATDRFDQDVQRTGSRWALAAYARSQAILAGGDGADVLFRQSVSESLDQPFDAARSHLCWGESLRRRRNIHDSREQLSTAATIFDGLEAGPWAERARRELRATGTRPPKPQPTVISELTPQELRVAITVTQGLSNRDTASQLFISPKTVEHHLSCVYQKLGLRSRTELVRLMTSLPHP